LFDTFNKEAIHIRMMIPVYHSTKLYPLKSQNFKEIRHFSEFVYCQGGKKCFQWAQFVTAAGFDLAKDFDCFPCKK